MRNLISESFEIYKQGGAEAVEAWRDTLSPEELSELTRQTAVAAQALQDAFARSFLPLQEAVARLAEAINKGKVK